MHYLRVVYLPAIRDVTQEFRTGNGSKIAKVLKNEFKNTDEHGDDPEFKQIFTDANDKAVAYSYKTTTSEEYFPIQSLSNKINQLTHRLSLKGDSNEVSLSFTEQEFSRILTNVTMKMKTNNLHIQNNGLGYNNLIFIATILTELRFDSHDKNPHHFNCLIIEEPEAHLHPQLQKLLLEFLENDFKDIQILVTSHSPTLISNAKLDSLNTLAESQKGISSIVIQETDLSENHKLFLKKYLDVTKSQLFFARKIIFVEGITEAILLKAMWDRKYAEDDRFDNQSIEIVNIQGVAFEHYVELVNTVFRQTNVRTVVITDDDRGTNKTQEHFDRKTDTQTIVETFARYPVSNRFKNINQQVKDLRGKGCNIRLFSAEKTFEVALGTTNFTNTAFLQEVYSFTPAELSGKSNLWVGIETWKTSLNKKSEYAEKILGYLQDKTKTFDIPTYITDAFEFLNTNHA